MLFNVRGNIHSSNIYLGSKQPCLIPNGQHDLDSTADSNFVAFDSDSAQKCFAIFAACGISRTAEGISTYILSHNALEQCLSGILQEIGGDFLIMALLLGCAYKSTYVL